jgi:hypothetical protein
MKSFYENNIFRLTKQIISGESRAYTRAISSLLGRITQLLSSDISATRLMSSFPVTGDGEGLADIFWDTDLVCIAW